MIEVLATVLTCLALAAAVWAAALVVAGRAVELRAWHGLWLYGLLALIELGLVAQLVAGVVRMATDDREVAALEFLGYLLTTALLLPAAAFWALLERTRWGPAVLVVGCLTIPVLIIRLRQVWEAHV